MCEEVGICMGGDMCAKGDMSETGDICMGEYVCEEGDMWGGGHMSGSWRMYRRRHVCLLQYTHTHTHTHTPRTHMCVCEERGTWEVGYMCGEGHMCECIVGDLCED